MKNYKYFIVEKKDGYAIVTINNPSQMNALRKDLQLENLELMQELEQDDSIRSIIYTGQGKTYIAGADITDMEGMTDEEYRDYFLLGHTDISYPEKSNKIYIAAINGYTFGGGLESTLAFDFRFASTNATFGLPEITLGIIPGAGGTQRLARIIGVARAKEMIFTGERIKADKALEYGIVTRVFEPEDLLPETEKFAQSLNKVAPLALQAAKRAIGTGLENMPLKEGLDVELEESMMLNKTADKTEGMLAFMEKRDAKFTGK